MADLDYSLCFLWDFLEQLHFLPSWCLLATNRPFGSFYIPESNMQQLVLLEQVVDIPFPLLNGVLRYNSFLFLGLVLLQLLRLLGLLLLLSWVLGWIMLWLWLL